MVAEGRLVMKVYIAGPMTGHDDHNHPAFHEAAEIWSEMGHIVLNPATHPVGLSFADYMHIDLAMVDICDMVIFLQGWEQSKGAQLEHAHAKRLGKGIAYEREGTDGYSTTDTDG